MKCDETDPRNAWIFVVAGENERDRLFREGVLREARERGFRRVLPMYFEGGVAKILANEGTTRGRPPKFI